MADGFELDERELVLLTLACKQVDDLAERERALKHSGIVVEGSKGQPRVNPIAGELRQGRLAVARLLGDLQLPDADAAPRSAASRRGQNAARVRWDAQAARLEARRGA